MRPPLIPEILQPIFGTGLGAVAILYGIPAALLLGTLVGLWLAFGFGPRRRRGFRQARRLLQQGNWVDALARVQTLRDIGIPSSGWLKTFDQFEAECLQAAAQSALDEKNFETALEHAQKAAHLLDQSELDARLGVQAAMLREVRHLFATPGETRATEELIARTLMVQSPCREASFWQGLCELRANNTDRAMVHLQTARTGLARTLGLEEGQADPDRPGTPASAPVSPFIDPPLYMGAVMLRRGQAKEALRYLTEANRLDAGCPIITLQLGAAMIAAGGDTQFAVRALQRALGPRGLGQWESDARRAWVEALPEHRSYVRKLAEEFPYTCPLFGNDLIALERQGHFALAQGHYRLANYQEAADLFGRTLDEGAPSHDVLRGLGLSLAKLGRYDDAFKHLRTAHEMEPVKDRLTAGYLALCGACGTPSRAEDRPRNLAWAVKLVQQFNAPGDVEWVSVINPIFAEARKEGVALSADDQLYLCEHLVTVAAADPISAQAYHHLAATAPQLVRLEYAWLYCRADQQHPVGGEKALALYAQTFARPNEARAFFTAQGWDFDAVEFAYLERAAEREPGRFPAALGPDYPPQGEALLLKRSEEAELAGHAEEALRSAEVLARLAPHNTRALDRAAALHYRAGRLDRAIELLAGWHAARPDDPLPLVRQAVLLDEQGQADACRTLIRQAAALCTDRRRANVLFLGARLLLRDSLLADDTETTTQGLALDEVQGFLDESLAHDPTHAPALWCLAAVRWLRGDLSALASQAAAMTAATSPDPRFHFFAALCHLVGDRYEEVLAACEQIIAAGSAAGHEGRNGDAAGRLNLALEGRYLAAYAEMGLGRRGEAIAALQAVAQAQASPTRPLALALLGCVLFVERDHEEALRSWQLIDPKQRQAWGLNEPLAQTTFVAALEALFEGKYETSAEKFRQAGRLGCRDRRLGPLLLLALFKAGQQAIYAGETAPVGAGS